MGEGDELFIERIKEQGKPGNKSEGIWCTKLAQAASMEDRLERPILHV